jgi:hypothetical protein
MSDEFASVFAREPNRPLPFQWSAEVRVSRKPKVGSGRASYFLKTPSGELFEFGEEEHFVWKAFSGSRSAAEIDRLFFEHFGLHISPQQLVSFANDLVTMRLIDHIGAPSEDNVEFLRTPRRIAPDGPRAVSVPPPVGRRRTEPIPTLREPWTASLGNPTKVFSAVAYIFWPVRFLLWGLVPLTFVSFLIILHHWAQYWSGLLYLWNNTPWYAAVYAIELLMLWLSRAVQGVVICGYGGTVKSFRVKLFMGWLLRAHIDESSIKDLPRTGQLWVYASTLIFRAAVFGVGCFVWVESLQSHPTIANVALIVTTIGLATFIFCSFPLLPQDGYRWLCVYVDQPNLQSRAFTFLRNWMMGRRMPRELRPEERGALLFFAAGTLICTTIWLAWLFLQMYIAAIRSYRGLGMAWVIITFTLGIIYFFLLWKFVTRMRDQRRLMLTQHFRNMRAVHDVSNEP